MASGIMQLLKTFGIDIDPEEIKAQALQFKALGDSIDARLAIIQAQNAAIMRALKIDDENGAQNIGPTNSGNAESTRHELSAVAHIATN